MVFKRRGKDDVGCSSVMCAGNKPHRGSESFVSLAQFQVAEMLNNMSEGQEANLAPT